jgi:hypothetical protein
LLLDHLLSNTGIQREEEMRKNVDVKPINDTKRKKKEVSVEVGKEKRKSGVRNER